MGHAPHCLAVCPDFTTIPRMTRPALCFDCGMVPPACVGPPLCRLASGVCFLVSHSCRIPVLSRSCAAMFGRRLSKVGAAAAAHAPWHPPHLTFFGIGSARAPTSVLSYTKREKIDFDSPPPHCTPSRPPGFGTCPDVSKRFCVAPERLALPLLLRPPHTSILSLCAHRFGLVQPGCWHRPLPGSPPVLPPQFSGRPLKRLLPLPSLADSHENENCMPVPARRCLT